MHRYRVIFGAMLVIAGLLAVIFTATVSRPQSIAPSAITPPLSFPLIFTCAKAVHQHYGEICVKTQPGAALTITITYCSGHQATSEDLGGMFYAGVNGTFQWDWTPQTGCLGTAIADVVARWHGMSREATASFSVV